MNIKNSILSSLISFSIVVSTSVPCFSMQLDEITKEGGCASAHVRTASQETQTDSTQEEKDSYGLSSIRSTIHTAARNYQDLAFIALVLGSSVYTTVTHSSSMGQEYTRYTALPFVAYFIGRELQKHGVRFTNTPPFFVYDPTHIIKIDQETQTERFPRWTHSAGNFLMRLSLVITCLYLMNHSLNSRPAFSSAVSEGCPRTALQALFPHYWDTSTLLHEAASERCPKTAQLLIDSGDNVNERNNFGETPLHLAGATGDLPLIRMFLETGSNIHTPDFLGNAPIFVAYSPEDSEELQEMLQRAYVKAVKEKHISPTYEGKGHPPFILRKNR